MHASQLKGFTTAVTFIGRESRGTAEPSGAAENVVWGAGGPRRPDGSEVHFARFLSPTRAKTAESGWSKASCCAPYCAPLRLQELEV